MHQFKSAIRSLVAVGSLAVLASTPALAQQNTRVNFQLDWRMEGPAALFLLGEAEGYYREEGLNVSIDTGSGAAAAITRVASGAYDMGFGDMSALVEFLANNPDSPGLRAVMVVYDATPATVFALKRSGIESPEDLAGKTLAAPSFDGGRRTWDMFAEANGIAPDSVSWQSVDPALRETMLARGEADAITGFYFTSLINLESRGVDEDDLVMMPYSEYGVPLYGNVIVASDRFIENNPDAVSAFLRAFTRSMKDVLADPDAAVEYVRRRDELIDVATEQRRLKLAIEGSIDTPEARENGVGGVDMERLQTTIDQLAEVFGLENPPTAEAVFDTSFLPDQDDRRVFPD
ncbi:MAG: ABC transporter substrate-binding protein [Ectothiorhodospiraceae bacterium]|nr:ABC transporter substrate-binding protein [Ectothiorhodospiraceae bacterium]